MKLSKEDKQILLEMGCKEKDFWQIEEVSKKTIYEEYNKSKDENRGRISAKRAIEVLGKKKFLASLERSAFHRSASNTSEDCKIVIYFNSYKAFEEWGGSFNGKHIWTMDRGKRL